LVARRHQARLPAEGREDDNGLTGDVGNLFVHDLSSGRRTQLTDLEISRAYRWYLSPSFSPDGRNLTFHLPRSRSETTKWDAWSVPATGGEPTLVMRNAAFPMYIADGKWIAFVVPAASDFAGHTVRVARADGEGSPRDARGSERPDLVARDVPRRNRDRA
jgi:Tol biopolymer transport system component